MDNEVAAPDVQAGLAVGEDKAVVTALREKRKARSEARKEQTEQPKPEAKTEPKGQPEQKVEEAEQPEPTAKQESKTETPSDEPKAPETDTPKEAKESPKLKISVDGKEEEVSLDEARSGYMRQRDYTHKTMEHAKERETFSNEMAQQRQVIDITLQELSALSQHMVQRLVGEDHRTDWHALKENDPEQYALKVAERSENRELLRQVLAKATQLDQQRRSEEDKKRQTEHETRKLEEERKLALMIPEFSDPTKAKAIKSELSQYLVDRGFSKDEVGSVLDHRFISLARDALSFKRIQEARTKAETEKKVTGKLIASPSPATPKAASNVSKIESLKARVVKSGGNLNDVANLLKERRKARK